MDLQELQANSGISRRKLRYVLDHQLVPQLSIEIAPDEAGRPRKFAEDVGFGIVCAAKLLDVGLSHETIRRFLRGLLEIYLGGRGAPKLALVAILEQRQPARGILGDGINVRIVIDDPEWDSKWVAPGNPAKLAADYQPTVEILLDLGQIRDQVRGDRAD